jgi:hypothetical protein
MPTQKERLDVYVLSTSLKCLKLCVHLLVVIEEALEDLDAKTGIETAGCSADAVHAQLWNTRVDGSQADAGAGHGSDGAARARVVADLEDLEGGAALVCNTVEYRRADAISCHVAVRVGGDGDTNIESRSVVLEVDIEEVGVDGVDDVGGDQETVGDGLGEQIRAVGVLRSKCFCDALDHTGHVVGAGTLAEERTDFLVIKHADHLHNSRGTLVGRGK